MLEALPIVPAPRTGVMRGRLQSVSSERTELVLEETETSTVAAWLIFPDPGNPEQRISRVAEAIEARLAPAELDTANAAVEAILEAEFGDLETPE